MTPRPPPVGVVDVGGTKTLVAISVDGALRLPALRVPTPQQDPVAGLDRLLTEVAGGVALSHVAVAVPGPLDHVKGVMAAPPNLSAAWQHLDLAGQLGRLQGCPVGLRSDSLCGAVAEARRGAGMGARTVLFLTVSTGVGGAFVLDGAPTDLLGDAEPGHIVIWPERLGGPACACGGHGCLEALVSGTAIRRRTGRPAEAVDDPAVWEDVGSWLGLGIASLCAVRSPDVVVLGGGVMAAANRLWEPMLRSLAAARRIAPLPDVRLGTLGEERNLIGALEQLDPAGGGRD